MKDQYGKYQESTTLRIHSHWSDITIGHISVIAECSLTRFVVPCLSSVVCTCDHALGNNLELECSCTQ